MKDGRHGCETVPKRKSDHVPRYCVLMKANHSHLSSVTAGRKSGRITKATYWHEANSIYFIMQTAGHQKYVSDAYTTKKDFVVEVVVHG